MSSLYLPLLSVSSGLVIRVITAGTSEEQCKGGMKCKGSLNYRCTVCEKRILLYSESRTKSIT